MRRLILWTLALLGVPHLAAADVATGLTAGQVLGDAEAANEASDTRVLEFPPALDLRISGRQLPTGQDRPIDPGVLGAGGVDRYGAAARDSADDGLSFGLEVKRRPQLESRTRPDEDEAPSLQGGIERLIEHSTLGIRGSYRF
jgi:hypothetical protein